MPLRNDQRHEVVESGVEWWRPPLKGGDPIRVDYRYNLEQVSQVDTVNGTCYIQCASRFILYFFRRLPPQWPAPSCYPAATRAVLRAIGLQSKCMIAHANVHVRLRCFELP